MCNIIKIEVLSRQRRIYFQITTNWF